MQLNALGPRRRVAWHSIAAPPQSTARPPASESPIGNKSRPQVCLLAASPFSLTRSSLAVAAALPTRSFGNFPVGAAWLR
eukprot:6446413-Alexandrium_andersonii.AAC.1